MVAILYALARVPWKWLLIVIPAIIYKGTENLLYGLAQANPALYHLPYAGEVIFQFAVPLLGPVTLTYGGFSWAFSNTLRIPLLCLLSFTFIYSTSITDLIKTLASLKIPGQIIYILTVAFKFIPGLYREYNTTITAQRLRGWEMRTRNPVKAAKMAPPLVTPFVHLALGYVDKLTLSASVRGFGIGKTKYPWGIKMTPLNWIISISSIICLAIGLYFLIFYGMGLL